MRAEIALLMTRISETSRSFDKSKEELENAYSQFDREKRRLKMSAQKPDEEIAALARASSHDAETPKEMSVDVVSG